jgi:hypothetical protein
VDAFLDPVENEASHFTMVGRPLSILRIGTAGGRWWMEVISRVVGIRMSVPSAFPRPIRVVLLIVNIEVVIPIPPNLESSRYLTWIALIRQFDADMQVSFFDDFCRFERPTSDESGTQSLQY